MFLMKFDLISECFGMRDISTETRVGTQPVCVYELIMTYQGPFTSLIKSVTSKYFFSLVNQRVRNCMEDTQLRACKNSHWLNGH